MSVERVKRRLLDQVTVVIPCRDEEEFISVCIESILAGDYPKDRLELLVVDGMSDDRTRSIVGDYCRLHPFIKLFDNVRRITPAAFNLGIQKAKGDIIMLMGSHSRYSSNYISGLVAWLDKSGADNVGGVCMTLPSDETPLAHAIALGLSHPFGVGNAYFRIGSSEPRWVDTVFGGCYRKDVFDRIGLFDEQMVKNQDDEFNHRLLRHGGRILLVPDIVSYYYPRRSLSKLWQMYYQYGYFKPLAARKIRGIMTARQLIPAIFVLTFLGTSLLAPWFMTMRYGAASIILIYAALDIGFSIFAAFEKGARCGLWLSLVFPVLHISYGLGYMKGFFDFLILRKKPSHKLTPVPLTR